MALEMAKLVFDTRVDIRDADSCLDTVMVLIHMTLRRSMQMPVTKRKSWKL
jgi:hypothetical protein